ncbi:MAG: CDP-diacylglycerol--glycerol-3-phosphate 3-phosphatidyltransferase [Erysipelotrichaceae bacterium]|nr:CDP-diacylglycerol--glycerol-3-phosphate 3-phosphatidyltransferase [Erysipelotrichaceae bacterium]MBO4538346.1 CDP-diacylglycerol--glycerol-3-phosphate 3-phosphatidyltransferase [Erysipelotrichaceae bacterium]MBR5048462.1 CDP-diacylglycerol--glycerol-3-phosphate 3-phosphatidyltransferase [Erysipelotrichaceae bacterium]
MNLPNKLTLFRLILIPIIVLVWVLPYSQLGLELPSYHIGYLTLSLKNIIVLVLFILGSVSDFLDGFLARMNNQVTTFGKFADPIADKCLTTTMFILFASENLISAVPVLIMVWRDIVVDGIRLIASSRNVVMSARTLGKLKTASQMLCIIVILLNNIPFQYVNIPMADILLWFSTLMSLASGVSYYSQGKAYIWESK